MFTSSAGYPEPSSMADWVRELKRGSSVWMKDSKKEPCFEWQKGYAVFSVSHSNFDAVREYIAHQDEHHKKRSFQDELREFLRKHALDCDENYLWD